LTNANNEFDPDDRRRMELLLLRNRHILSARNFVKLEQGLPGTVETLIPLQTDSDAGFSATFVVVRHALSCHFTHDWRSSFQSGPDGIPVE
jgi:hypothetical protein